MNTNSLNKDITAVIPSIHPKKINNLIKKFVKWTMIPGKIIIVFPNEKKYKLNFKFSKKLNIKILFSKKKGQVHQRLYGIKYSKSKIMLQMDDDLLIENNCLEEMYYALKKLGKKNVVGAVLYDYNKKDYFYNINRKNFILFHLQNLYEILILGANRKIYNRLGTVSKAGFTFGYNPSLDNKKNFIIFKKNNIKLRKVDWLNSFLLTYSSDLIKKNYFKFSGKAYYEDLFHNEMRKKKKINNFISLTSFYSIGKEKRENNLYKKILEMFNEINIRKQFVIFTKKNLCFFYLATFFEIQKKIIIFFLRKINLYGN